MKLVDNLTKKEYQSFFNKSKYNHFLQSYEWGKTCELRGQKELFLGLYDDKNKLVAATMVLKKNTPLHMNYLYAPRGIIIDYENKELLENFTAELKKYLKKTNAIYFKMDPAIIYEEIDLEGNPIEGGKNNYELFDTLVKLGYKHQGFTKLFNRNQPRYTFRIDTSKGIEEVEKNMNKTFLKTIKRSYNYDLEVTNDYDNETFYNLMREIAKRNNFNGNPKSFYEAFEKSFKEEGNVHYITIKIHPDKILSKSRKELNDLQDQIKNNKIPEKRMADTNNIISHLEKDIKDFEPYEGKYPDGYVALVLICPKTNHAMWTLYIGNDDNAFNTFAVNRAYYEAMKIACEEKMEFLDLFGVPGDPHTEEKNYRGIYEYKRKMGGTYTEFIGEFDLVNKPFWHKVLPTLLKIYRKIKK